MSSMTDSPHRVSGLTHAVNRLHEGSVEANHPWVAWEAQKQKTNIMCEPPEMVTLSMVETFLLT